MNSNRTIRAQVQPGDRIRVLPAVSHEPGPSVFREMMLVAIVASVAFVAAFWWACQ